MLIKGIYRSVNCLMMIFACLNYDDVAKVAMAMATIQINEVILLFKDIS